MSEMIIEKFYKHLLEDLLISSRVETYRWEVQLLFTAVFLKCLEELRVVNSLAINPFQGYSLQLKTCAFAEDYGKVDIIVNIFDGSRSLQFVSRNDVDAAIQGGIWLYKEKTNNLYTSFKRVVLFTK